MEPNSKIVCVIVGFAMVCGGCYSNRLVIDPWEGAPRTSSTVWKAPSKVKLSKPCWSPVRPEGENPLTLAEVIDLALQNSPQTAQSWASARQAAASYAQAQSTDFPTIDGNYSWSRSRSLSGPTFGSTASTILYLSSWGPQLSLSYTILDFGQQRATSEAARYALYFSDWTHNYTIQTLIQTVTDDYYNYLYQKELLIANEEDLVTAQTTLDAASLGFQTGVNDVSDVLQARTQMLQTAIQLTAQRQQLENAYAQLLSDMGLPADFPITVERMPHVDPDTGMLQDVDQLMDLALKQRPDLLAAEATVKSKEESLLAAKRQFWPSLAYSLNYGKTTYTGWVSDKYDFTSMLSVSLPIFTGFSNLNQVRQAQATKELAEAQLVQTRLSVIQGITTSYTSVYTARDTVKFSCEFLASSLQQYKVVLSQYKAGTNTITNLVSAQSSLATARAQDVSSRQQWFTSLTALAYATGSLSEPQQPIEEKSP